MVGRIPILGISAFVFICILFSLGYNHADNFNARPLRPYEYKSKAPDGTFDPLDFYFNTLYKPSVKPTSSSYKPSDAFAWPQSNDVYWKDNLKKRFCIIDLDNRPLNGRHQIFGQDILSWEHGREVHGLSAGILNHWIYSKIHGYKYYFVQIDEPKDRRASWKKAVIMTEILKKHDACVFIDSDAIFPHLDLPFEWLMNYWRINPDNNSLALANDPDEDYNKDRWGRIYLNTGFIVAQNNAKTYQILDAWNRCADDGEPYANCTEFRKNSPGRPTDQGGFGTYIRYDYFDDIRELPCTEANGFPLSGTDCHGQFIRHLWTGKDDHIKVEVGMQTPGPYLELLHRQFLAEKSSFHLTEKQLLHGTP